MFSKDSNMNMVKASITCDAHADTQLSINDDDGMKRCSSVGLNGKDIMHTVCTPSPGVWL